MFENFKPSAKKVLVKIIEHEMQSEGGIILASDSEETFRRGSVMALGTETDALCVGDSVIFGKYAGLPLLHGYYILDISEIYGTE